jgi:hypothetical protein
MFNLLTGPQLLDRVEHVLPEHRERQFPPTGGQKGSEPFFGHKGSG